MSRLSDIVAEAIAETAGGRVRDQHAAASLVVERAGKEEREVLLYEAALLRCKKAQAARGPAGERAGLIQGQLSLFPRLFGAYPVDLDGGPMVQTGELTRVEFKRIISIREKQIVDDTARLKDLREAYVAVSPFWDAHPDWSFGQCCAALAKLGEAA